MASVKAKVNMESLPSWERGLKLFDSAFEVSVAPVAPLVGAWIEIITRKMKTAKYMVAPLVGAWIEIGKFC